MRRSPREPHVDAPQVILGRRPVGVLEGRRFMRNRSVRVRRWGPLVNKLLDPPRKNFRGEDA